MTSPVSAVMSFYLMKARFSSAQVWSIVMVVFGVITACFVQLAYETKEEQFQLKTGGLVILVASSFFNAGQAVIEQKIFLSDPLLSPWVLCGAEAFWKLMILLLFGPFYKRISVSKHISNTGTLENFQ